jgi:hypothetical protein
MYSKYRTVRKIIFAHKKQRARILLHCMKSLSEVLSSRTVKGMNLNINGAKKHGTPKPGHAGNARDELTVLSFIRPVCFVCVRIRGSLSPLSPRSQHLGVIGSLLQPKQTEQRQSTKLPSPIYYLLQAWPPSLKNLLVPQSALSAPGTWLGRFFKTSLLRV